MLTKITDSSAENNGYESIIIIYHGVVFSRKIDYNGNLTNFVDWILHLVDYIIKFQSRNFYLID